jgi:hypothetical protein
MYQWNAIYIEGHQSASFLPIIGHIRYNFLSIKFRNRGFVTSCPKGRINLNAAAAPACTVFGRVWLPEEGKKFSKLDGRVAAHRWPYSDGIPSAPIGMLTD